MQGRYRGRYVIAPPITQFPKRTREGPRPSPGRGLLFLVLRFLSRPAMAQLVWRARWSSSPRRISNAASLTFLAQPSPRSLLMVRPSVEMGATSSPMWCASQFGEGLDFNNTKLVTDPGEKGF